TTSTEKPPLKDKSIWSDQEKRIQKIDRLARSHLIQGLSNDIYSLIDSNKTAKDLWDALARHMLSSEYGEQDRKAQNQGDVNDTMGSKKKTIAVTSDPLALIAEKTNEGHFAKDCKKAKVNDYKYYKTKMLLAKKDKDEQVLLAEDQAWMESSSDSNQEINAHMVFMAQIEKVLSDSEACSSSADKKISKASSSSADEKISEEKYAKLEAERYEYMIRYSAYFDNDKQHRKQIADQQVLYDKMSVQLFELDKHVRDLKNTILEKDFKISELEECVRNKDLEIEKCLEHLNVCENKLHKMGQTNQTVHMIMPSKDNLHNGRKRIGFENPSNFEKAKDLRPMLYDEKIVHICLWIIDSGCSKHMMGNRALLMNFVKKFLETVRFGNNDFVVIVGYGDVVIGSMTIKKFYYVEGLGHNLFSVGQFCDKGLEVAFRKSTCFVRNEDGVDLLTGDRSSNLHTIALNEVVSNSSTCLLAKASSSQSWL
nr:integrase, catalytic region, zinc finger, CCHC-type, peptidase aspartic, catalytic [Tanacetum cinerariifolium]